MYSILRPLIDIRAVKWNHIKYSQILFCTVTSDVISDRLEVLVGLEFKRRWELLSIRNISNNSNNNFLKPIEKAKRIIKELQGLELRLETELNLETLKSAHLDGLLQQALDEKDWIAIKYIIKEAGTRIDVQKPSRYILERIMIRALPKYDLISSINEYFRATWMDNYLAAALWYRGNIIESTLMLKKLYFESDKKDKELILFLIHEISNDTVGLKSEATLVTLINLTEYFFCFFDEIRPLMIVWQTTFTSTWFSDQQLAENLYTKYSDLRQELFHTGKITMLFQSFLAKHEIETCQRLTELCIKCNETEASRTCLRLLFDYHYFRSDLKSCSEVMKYCLNENLNLTEDENKKLLDLLLGIKPSKSDKKRTVSTPRITFKF